MACGFAPADGLPEDVSAHSAVALLEEEAAGLCTSILCRASVFPFQNYVNSVSGFANSVFYRFRFDKFRFLPFHIFKILFHIFSSRIFGVNDFY